jgi:TonB family protein
MSLVRLTISIVIAFFLAQSAFAFRAAQTFKTAVLRVAGLSDGQFFYNNFRRQLVAQKNLQILDDDLTRSAVAGLKIENPFNLSLAEAKNLGAATDCNYFFVVKDETLRRSSSSNEVYFESSVIIFLANARTGHLVAWEHVFATADAPEAAERKMLDATAKIVERFVTKMAQAEVSERRERAQNTEAKEILKISGEEMAENSGFRIPLPYKRLQPNYTLPAQKADVEATVDVAVEINAEGIVEKTEIERWAGFDLDEEVARTVKKMQFRPALKNDAPVRSRFLLRYKFRRPRGE